MIIRVISLLVRGLVGPWALLALAMVLVLFRVSPVPAIVGLVVVALASALLQSWQRRLVTGLLLHPEALALLRRADKNEEEEEEEGL